MKNNMFFLILGLCLTILIANDSTKICIEGKVKYDGKLPRAKKLNMAADPICGKAHGTNPVFNESFKANSDGYLENVLVWVINPKHSAKFPENIVLNQVVHLFYYHRNFLTNNY